MSEPRPKTPRDYRELLRAGSWFRAVPDALQEPLLAAAHLRRLVRRDRLFSRGDPPCGLYAVLDGAIRVSGVAETGKEALLALAEPPSWFGEISVFDGLPRTHDAIAETDSLLLHVPQAPLDELLAREPRLWRELGRLVAGKLRLAFLVIEDTAVLPPAVRLARRLLFMTEGYGDWFDRRRRVVAIRQEQLAMMLNLSRQTANQLLKELEARGVIRLAYGEIEVLDADGLRAAAAPVRPDEP
ncbi:MAG TPA: Crp/Fnr family transcriptional regulator [Kofleriaceae bacterium]|nr:Crp/Fnr family transcriptional regulator [Kofleriaceae bacterium]